MTNNPRRGLGNRPALSRCIRVDSDTFAVEHWGRLPLLSPADSLPSGFDDLFSSAAVDELISTRGIRTPFVRMANEGSVLDPSRYTAPGGFGAEVGDQVSSEKVLAEFAAGATLVLQGLHRTWGPLNEFTRALIGDIGHPAQVNAYITPAASRGFDPHYDVHDVFVLQVEGEKHWRIHAPAHPDPLRGQPWTGHRDAVARQAEEEPVIDTVLRPGDALYLPRGWIHSATALGGTSVHLTIGMAAFTRYEIVSAALGAAAENPRLRRSLPLGLDLGGALSPTGEGSGALAVIVAETVVDLIEQIGGGLESVNELSSLVTRRLAERFGSVTRPEPIRLLATVDRSASLGPADRLRWRAGLGGDIREVEGGPVQVVLAAKTLSLPAQCAGALRQLRAGAVVPLDEFAGLDLEDAVVVGRRLLREGIVVLA